MTKTVKSLKKKIEDSNAFLFILARNLKQPRCLSIHLHNGVFLGSLKKKKRHHEIYKQMDGTRKKKFLSAPHTQINMVYVNL